MKKNNVKQLVLPLFICVILFNSCIGMSIDIQMNRDGSGKLTMEYRISQMLQNLGAFDGNESLPTIPVGRDDWERTVERTPGVKLGSFSSKTAARETTISVTLEYENEQALSSLLDQIGEKVSIKRQGQSGTIDFLIIDDSMSLLENLYDESMMSLMRVFMDSYNFSMSFSGPGNSSLTFTDNEGKTIPAPKAAQTTLSGRKVSFSIGIMDIFDMTDGLGVKFNW